MLFSQKENTLQNQKTAFGIASIRMTVNFLCLMMSAKGLCQTFGLKIVRVVD